MFKMRGQMNKGRLLILLAVAIFSGAIALNADEKDASMTEENFKEYVSDGKYFSILILKNWSGDEAIMTRRNMKIYGIEIAMPMQKEDTFPVKITVEYYAKDNVLYKTPKEFIERLSQPDPTLPSRGREYGPVTNTSIAGMKAKQFERKIPEFVPPYSVKQKEILIYEKYIVAPAEEGYYVFTYQSPVEQAKSRIQAFEKVISSFKPFKPLKNFDDVEHILKKKKGSGKETRDDNAFQKFVMDNNYFSCEIPKNWEFERNKEYEEKYKVYKVRLFGPGIEKSPTTIYVTFYAKENKLFKDHNDFIERNSKDVFSGTGDEDEKYTPVKQVTLNKNKAFYFESETKEYLNPESKSEEFVIVKERYYVIPSKNGFYVLHYLASKPAFQKYLRVFKRVVSSFKTGS